MPLPEAIVQAQVDDTLHNAIHALDHDEAAFAEALEKEGSTREEFDADNRSNSEKAVKTQLLMDAVADKLDIQVGQNDLTERLVLMSRQYGSSRSSCCRCCSRTTSCLRCSPTCGVA